MGKKKEKPIDLRNLEPEEKLKYEVAEELGLLGQGDGKRMAFSYGPRRQGASEGLSQKSGGKKKEK